MLRLTGATMKVPAVAWRVIAAIFVAVPLVVEAQQPGSTFPDRFMVPRGYGYVLGASANFTFNGLLTEGSGAVEFDTLGGEREDEFWRLDAVLRLNPRHGFFVQLLRRDAHRSSRALARRHARGKGRSGGPTSGSRC